MKDENNFVEVCELRGFISGTLMGAFNKIKAKQFLYSLSLNLPVSDKVSTSDFEDAINQIEKNLV